MSDPNNVSEASKPTRQFEDWPDLDLSIEELDEPVFQPQQIVPNVAPLPDDETEQPGPRRVEAS